MARQRISHFIFRLNRNLFTKFVLSEMMIRSKSYKYAFIGRMYVSFVYLHFPASDNAILVLSLPISLLPAITLSVLCVSVNCCILLTGSDYCDSCRVQLAWRFRVRQCISLKRNSWTELFAAVSRVRIRNRTGLARLFIGTDWPISTLTIFAND